MADDPKTTGAVQMPNIDAEIERMALVMTVDGAQIAIVYTDGSAEFDWPALLSFSNKPHEKYDQAWAIAKALLAAHKTVSDVKHD